MTQLHPNLPGPHLLTTCGTGKPGSPQPKYRSGKWHVGLCPVRPSAEGHCETHSEQTQCMTNSWPNSCRTESHLTTKTNKQAKNSYDQKTDNNLMANSSLLHTSREPMDNAKNHSLDDQDMDISLGLVPPWVPVHPHTPPHTHITTHPKGSGQKNHPNTMSTNQTRPPKENWNTEIRLNKSNKDQPTPLMHNTHEYHTPAPRKPLHL